MSYRPRADLSTLQGNTDTDTLPELTKQSTLQCIQDNGSISPGGVERGGGSRPHTWTYQDLFH